MTKELVEPLIRTSYISNGLSQVDRAIKIIIPIYNEENTITNLIKRIQCTFSKLNKTVEIICVDDGSIDNTREILNKLDIMLLCNERNLGKGEALKKGFKYCDYSDTIITLDGDGEHCPEDIPELLKPILDGEADMIIGSRFLNTQNGNGSYLENKKYLSQLRKVGNQIFSIFGTMVTQKYITDTQSGFRAFKPNIINNLDLKSSGFEIETEIIIEALDKGYSIQEVPINNGKAFRDSYMNLVIDSLKIGLTFFSGIFPRKLKFILRFLTAKMNKIR